MIDKHVFGMELNNKYFGCLVCYICFHIKATEVCQFSTLCMSVNPVNPAISAFDLTGVWSTARKETCLASLRFLHSCPHCSRLAYISGEARRISNKPKDKMVQTTTVTPCKALWIKVSSKCINVNDWVRPRRISEWWDIFLYKIILSEELCDIFIIYFS